MPKVKTYRVFYRYADDDVEYSVLIDETSEDNARAALMQADRVTIVRVEEVQ